MIAAGAFEPFYLRIFTIDLTKLRASLVELPYRKLPGLRELLVAADQRAAMGDTVAIFAPYSWDAGYEYAYARSLYTLAGRRVVLQKEVAQAKWICAYGPAPVVAGFDVVWRGRGGVVMRRSQ